MIYKFFATTRHIGRIKKIDRWYVNVEIIIVIRDLYHVQLKLKAEVGAEVEGEAEEEEGEEGRLGKTFM